MLSRFSGIFKKEDVAKEAKKTKVDLKDLLIQIKELSEEEKQIVKTALEQPPVDESTVATTTTAVVAQSQAVATTTTTTTDPSYEYKGDTYRRRQD